jgi:hypothetical protein
MLPIIHEIQQKLEKFQNARFEYDSSSITYLPNSADGFAIRLIVEQTNTGARYCVFYSGCRQEFLNWKDAMMEFGFGLSTWCRLREYSRRGQPYRWVMEIRDDARRKPWWETIRWSAPFWQLWHRPHMRLLQNRLIDLDDGNEGCTA